MINKDLKYLLTHQNYALIGMNDDEEKIAYKIFFKLLEEHKTVTGIHPSLESVKEHTLVSSLEDITHPIDAVIFMVNPKIGINYLETIAKMNIQTIWLQPGTESEELIKRAKDLGLEVIENCVLTLLHQRIKAIVSDLDETLLRDDKEVSQKNFDIIQEIRNLGIHFIPATGRPYYSMKKTIQDLDLYKEDDYTLSYNGGMIHNNIKSEPIKVHG